MRRQHLGHHEVLLGVPGFVIDGGDEVGNGDGAFSGDAAVFVTGADHLSGLHTAAPQGQTETTSPMVAAGAAFLGVDLRRSPEFSRGNHQRGFE